MEPSKTDPSPAIGDRLESWKEIAAYLRRDITTVQRWEKRERMPVRRHVHDKLGTVYAFKSELDAWVAQRSPQAIQRKATVDPIPVEPIRVEQSRFASRRAVAGIIALSVIVAAVAWMLVRGGRRTDWGEAIQRASWETITDFVGAEQAAAISRDGRLVAFLSDRDGRMDLWITEIETGRFYNLTAGRVRELVNPSVRTLAFSPDGSLVTFWARGVEGAARDSISIWAVPVLGGEPRPYLEQAAEFDVSHDQARLVYHTPGPGDPLYVRELAGGAERLVYTAPEGMHAHFPTWAPDDEWIYLVIGSLPHATNIFRIRPSGDELEPITHHEGSVTHPVFLDGTTLAYLLHDKDTLGGRLHAVDVNSGTTRPLGTGFDRYTSFAAAGDGRRWVATLANPKGTLWEIHPDPAAAAAVKPISLPTGRGSAPRLGNGFMLYVARKGNGETLWKLADGRTTEVWTAARARIVAGPELDPSGSRVVLAAAHDADVRLHVIDVDGTNERVVARGLNLSGAPTWNPDGQSLTVPIAVDRIPQLFRVTLEGQTALLLQQFATDPSWSPDGGFLLYSGADIGTRIDVKAITPDGRPYPTPALSVTRGERRLRFVGDALAVMRGDLHHKDIVLIDLATGSERSFVNFPSDFTIRDFDVSADGKRVVVERVQEHSDVVRIDVPPGQ